MNHYPALKRAVGTKTCAIQVTPEIWEKIEFLRGHVPRGQFVNTLGRLGLVLYERDPDYAVKWAMTQDHRTINNGGQVQVSLPAGEFKERVELCCFPGVQQKLAPNLRFLMQLALNEMGLL